MRDVEYGRFTIKTETEVTKTLNVDKIKDLEDVKRVLKFLNIKATVSGYIAPNGFHEVSDLFE